MLVTADGAGLHLRCDDHDLDIRTTVAASTEETGSVVVSVGLLERFSSAVGDGAVILEDADGMLTVEAPTSNLRLRCADPDVWPVRQPIEGAGRPLTSEWDAVRRVAMAASTDAQRPNLTVVRFAADFVAATDSYRLHHVGVPDLGMDSLVPASALGLVLRHVDSERGATVRQHLLAASIDDGTTTWRLSLIDGDPVHDRWEVLVPQSRPHRLTVLARSLLDAIDMVTPVGATEATKERGPVVTLTVDDGADELVVSATGADVGEATAVVPASGSLPGPLHVQTRLLADAVEAAADDEVTLETADTHKPIVIASGRFTALVMPTRVPT
ncbi:MAG TPA: DNA polymerase III subunit beta [Acidimicrobiales bacterium]